MPTLRCKKCCDCGEMQEMPQQKSALEEARNREVASGLLL
jgi:hypothetical protein